MKTSPCFGGILLALGLAVGSSAQPANDHYTNRINLAGTDISFDGTLAGATRETNPFEVEPSFGLAAGVTQTAWWQWTPAESTTVIFQVLNPPLASSLVDGVQIYRLQNIYTGQYVAGRAIESQMPHVLFIFNALAGTNYQIQLAGSDGAAFSFRLVATNLPFIIEHPKSQTVTVADSVMFGVVAAGAKPFGYQWQLNGTNLTGETSPMLAFHHVTTDQAGVYSVVVTNSAGATFSQPANLFVTEADTAAILSADSSPGNNSFFFAAFGDIGRRYQVESSTNLSDWAAEWGFPSPFGQGGASPTPPKSVVFNASGQDIYGLSIASPEKFFRVKPFHGANEVCNCILKQIRFAQLLYAYDNEQAAGSSVSLGNISPYFKNSEILQCPLGGVQSITVILSNPSCSLHGFLEEP